MSIDLDLVMREQLVERRERVSAVIGSAGPDPQLTALLREVDAALERFESGSFGICQNCHDPVESERIISNPLERFCLGCLTIEEQRALEDDLRLAFEIQRGLLPPRSLRLDGWHFDYCYEPARMVSGDYIDIIPNGEGDLYFVLGDVSGKGIAASMLMAKLHAVFRSLIPLGLGVELLMERAGRFFSEGTLPGQYATLICGRASKQGTVTICNAGHPPALLNRDGKIEQVPATGFPLGMFPNQKFSAGSFDLENGDTLVLYTDGVPDAQNSQNEEYGMARLISVTSKCSSPPEQLVADCLTDIGAFRGDSQTSFDDISIMGIRRELARR